jgi:hypothetical protein
METSFRQQFTRSLLKGPSSRDQMIPGFQLSISTVTQVKQRMHVYTGETAPVQILAREIQQRTGKPLRLTLPTTHHEQV